MRADLRSRELLQIALIGHLLAIELIGDRIVDKALPQIRHDLQAIAIVPIDELYRRKALAELSYFIVLAMDLLHIERRGIDTIEVLLIEDKVNCPISELTYARHINASLQIRELDILEDLLGLSIIEAHKALGIL